MISKEPWAYSYVVDPYRYCVYCCADCKVEEPDHSDICPQVTGVYPVDSDMLEHGAVCLSCAEPFVEGSTYVHHELSEGTPHPVFLDELSNVRELWCLGCAANEQLVNNA